MKANIVALGCKTSVLDRYNRNLLDEGELRRVIGIDYENAFNEYGEIPGYTPNRAFDFLLITGGTNRTYANAPDKLLLAARDFDRVPTMAFAKPLEGFDQAILRRTNLIFEGDVELKEFPDPQPYVLPVREVEAALDYWRKKGKRLEVSLAGQGERFDRDSFLEAVRQLPKPFCLFDLDSEQVIPQHNGFALYLTSLGLHRTRIALDKNWEQVVLEEASCRREKGSTFLRASMPIEIYHAFQSYPDPKLKEFIYENRLIPRLCQQKNAIRKHYFRETVRNARAFATQFGEKIKPEEAFSEWVRQYLYVGFPKIDASFEPVSDTTAELRISSR